jgi:Glyoxalase-like domain
MAYDFQITVDAADPHTLADWWAETLGWVVEPSDENFIKRMVAEGYAQDSETTTYKGNLVWKTGAAIRHPDESAGGPGRRILFNQVPEAKTVKNRMHLDVWVGKDNVPAQVEQLIARGATRLYDCQQGPHAWVTMQDPERNEFCVS